MTKMNEKDERILDYIYQQTQENGFPPTVREIGFAVGLSSPASVQSRLNKLEALGYIERSSSKNRTMRLKNYKPKHIIDAEEAYTKEDYIDIPVYGKITAGIPITAVEQLERYFPIPVSTVRNKEVFMLHVSGESMINAAILDGDYIIVEKQPSAENGDIVVALVNGTDATVKTFYKEKGHFRLQPENETMQPIIAENVDILGKVIGVYRMF